MATVSSNKRKVDYYKSKSSSQPKTKRSANYRQEFLKKNKGVFGLGIYICYYCKKPVRRKNMEVDHIMPISRFGGSNSTFNLGPLCVDCNRKKSNKIDHRVLVGYGTKLVNYVFSLPFVLIGAILSLFWKLNFKIKIIVLGLLVFGLYQFGFVNV